ncbi:MAG: nucleoside-diphosphate-sugar pyrophosphorylase [Candidatus Omnitrophica bacterium CG11_big_fil_rev_8_21_14_0_20_41_12]|nr:MAG: nucleoside-diphosphate-sugar pyrophosphorylase [Candidatus Omnitrophica bacterium CG11_big_fil_rev_8_21_14_0_20_41_12]
MKALILAAGYATRLYPLTKEYPKPLLEVKGRPIIDYIVDKLEAVSGIDEIYIVTNNKFISVFRKWAKSVKTSKKVTLVNDLTKSNQDRLGAIGDIAFVIKKLKLQNDLLVVGGDNLFSGSLKGFLKFSVKNCHDASIGLYRLKNQKDASHYGVVKLDVRKAVISFEEKPAKPQSRIVAMCLYYIPKGRLALVRQYMQNKKIKTDATGSYIAWLKDKVDVYGYVFKGSWFDIGDYKYLNAAKKNFA